MTSDDEFRALGRYVYEFSRLISWMRVVLPLMSARDLAGDLKFGRVNEAMRLHTGEMAAAQLTDAYFGVAALVGDYTPDEANMSAWLRTQVLDAIKQRNDFLHGEWLIGMLGIDGEIVTSSESGEVVETSGELPPSLSRTKPGRREPQSVKQYDLDELVTCGDEIRALRRVTVEWGMAIAGNVVPIFITPEEVTVGTEPVRPSDLYVRPDGSGPVLREGPMAPHVPGPFYP